MSTRAPRITLWRNSVTKKWHWHWKAGNGKLISREAQRDGYVKRVDAIKGLEATTGGVFEMRYYDRGNRTTRPYGQGLLHRAVALGWVNGTLQIHPTTDNIFVEVLG